MDDKKLGIILLITAIFLLGFSFYSNLTGIFSFLGDPLVGGGFGVMCKSEEDCREFCSNNMGRCNKYCTNNPTNKLCERLFVNGGVR